MHSTSRKEKPNRHQILILDQHPLIQRGLSLLFEQEPSLHVHHCSMGSYEAFEAMLRSPPDLIIFDPLSSNNDCVRFIKAVKKRFPELAIMLLTACESTPYLKQLLQAGAVAYVNKQEMEQDILSAVYEVLQGNRYISPRLRQSL